MAFIKVVIADKSVENHSLRFSGTGWHTTVTSVSFLMFWVSTPLKMLLDQTAGSS